MFARKAAGNGELRATAFRKYRVRTPQEEALLIGFGYLLEAGVVATFILAGALLLRLIYISIFH